MRQSGGGGAPIVQLRDLTKTYDGLTRTLDQIQLELKPGDFLYVVGGSGVGKTTLLRLLATEDSPTQGSVTLFGHALSRISPPTLSAVRRSIGYIPQNVRLIPDLSVFDNVALSVSLAGSRVLRTEVQQRVGELLGRLGLSAKSQCLAGGLSGGEAQRVAVARALVRLPELIIADEPTGAQDKDYAWLLLDLFLKANLAGSTVVIATHDRELVRRVRKRCAILKGGRIQLEEAPCIY